MFDFATSSCQHTASHEFFTDTNHEGIRKCKNIFKKWLPFNLIRQRLIVTAVCLIRFFWGTDFNTLKRKDAIKWDLVKSLIRCKNFLERLCNWDTHNSKRNCIIHYLCNSWRTRWSLYNPWHGALMVECVVTWAADTLGNQTPHEVGTVLAPVRPSKCMYLELERTVLTHMQCIVSHCCVQSRLEKPPFWCTGQRLRRDPLLQWMGPLAKWEHLYIQGRLRDLL